MRQKRACLSGGGRRAARPQRRRFAARGRDRLRCPGRSRIHSRRRAAIPAPRGVPLPEWPLASRPARKTPPSGRRARATAPCPPRFLRADADHVLPAFARLAGRAKQARQRAGVHAQKFRKRLFPRAMRSQRRTARKFSASVLPMGAAYPAMEKASSASMRQTSGAPPVTVRKSGWAYTPEALPNAPLKAERRGRLERRG